MRSPALFLALAFLAGLLLPTPGQSLLAPLVCVACTLLVGAGLFARRRALTRASGLVLAGFAVLGQLASTVSEARSRRPTTVRQRYRALGEKAFDLPAQVTGRLRREPEASRDVTFLTVEAEQWKIARTHFPVRGGIRVSVRGAHRERLSELVGGDRIRFWARIREPKPFRNPGRFDTRAYREREGIELTASVKSALLVDRIEEARFGDSILSRARRWVLGRLADALDPSTTTFGITAALVTGDRAALAPRVERLYQSAGVFHIMAISGAHVAILTYLLYAASRRCGLDERPTLLFLITILPLYASFCGARPPVVRAVSMAVLVLGSRLASLRTPLVNGLALAAVLLLVWKPAYLGDPGFQLSFAAMIAIALLTEPLALALAKLGPLATPVAVSVSAQLGVLPVAAWHFLRVTPIAPFASVLAIPLAGIVIVLGFALAVVSGLPWVTTLLAMAVHGSVAALTWVAEAALVVPAASFRSGRPSLGALCLYLPALLALRFGSTRLRLASAGALGLLVATLFLPAPSTQGVLELTALDIGHGDALLMRMPAGENVLVDGGGLGGSSFDVGESVVLPFLLVERVRKLDAVLLTHTDFDHLGGLASVLREMTVDSIWEGPPGWERPAYARLRRDAVRRGVRFRRLWPGERFEWGGASWEVLAAGGVGGDGGEPVGFNDRSVVVRIEHGDARLLLTGDAEAGLERTLLGSINSLRADVLKVAHHGSKSSTTPAFLEAVSPRLAIISARRSLGRPVPSARVLHRLRVWGTDYLRTDRHGAIRVWLHPDGRLDVETFRGARSSE